MKKLLLLTMLVCAASISSAADKGASKYSVTITNVIKGQPLTPAVVAIHGAGYNLFKLGQEASQGLQELSKDGVTATLVAELDAKRSVVGTATGSGVVLPGMSETIEFMANGRKRISMVSMLARTNDAIAASRGMRLPVRKGQKVAYYLGVYDAGAEINTESCSDIPAPPCMNPMSGPAEGEGFVHAHPGVFGIKDLQVLRDTFGNIAAKVVITKMK